MSGQAEAGVIVQTRTASYNVSIPSPPFATAIGWLPNAFFDTTFLPFAGTGLTNAVFSEVNSFSVVFAGGGGVNFGFDGVVRLNGTQFMGVGGGGSVGTSPSLVNRSASASRDLVTSPVGTSASDVVGTNPLLFTSAPGSAPGVVHSTNFFVNSIIGTVSTTQTLTYTFTGDGALFSPPTSAPEPLSLGVLAVGAAAVGAARTRRRRAA